ncbi:MAG: sulfite exporter TauE/SafE family protein [Anaerolineae bacterium]
MWYINQLLPLCGFLVGLLVGLTGMGGGVVMTPLLMLGLGLPPTMAVGTDLAYATLTKLAGAWQHWRQGTVDFQVVRDLALGSLPASLAAVGLLTWLRRGGAGLADIWIQRAIGLALILAALLMLRRVSLGNARVSPARTPIERRAGVIAIGALGGFLVGLTSVGSGSLILALLVLVAPFSAEKLVGTDILHATLLVGTAALAHLYLGHVDLALVGKLLIGSVPGVLLGSRMTLRVPRQALEVGLAGLLMISAVQLLQ